MCREKFRKDIEKESFVCLKVYVSGNIVLGKRNSSFLTLTLRHLGKV
jgi:hypothetical protein